MTDRQQLIVNNVDTAKQLILDAERWIWAHPQTGYTEWQAHDYLAEKYEALGYTLVKAGNIPGFYTDVETGKPGPKVAIFGELDALDIANRSRIETAPRPRRSLRIHPPRCRSGRGDDPACIP